MPPRRCTRASPDAPARASGSRCRGRGGQAQRLVEATHLLLEDAQVLQALGDQHVVGAVQLPVQGQRALGVRPRLVELAEVDVQVSDVARERGLVALAAAELLDHAAGQVGQAQPLGVSAALDADQPDQLEPRVRGVLGAAPGLAGGESVVEDILGLGEPVGAAQHDAQHDQRLGLERSIAESSGLGDQCARLLEGGLPPGGGVERHDLREPRSQPLDGDASGGVGRRRDDLPQGLRVGALVERAQRAGRFRRPGHRGRVGRAGPAERGRHSLLARCVPDAGQLSGRASTERLAVAGQQPGDGDGGQHEGDRTDGDATASDRRIAGHLGQERFHRRMAPVRGR